MKEKGTTWSKVPLFCPGSPQHQFLPADRNVLLSLIWKKFHMRNSRICLRRKGEVREPFLYELLFHYFEVHFEAACLQSLNNQESIACSSFSPSYSNML